MTSKLEVIFVRVSYVVVGFLYFVTKATIVLEWIMPSLLCISRYLLSEKLTNGILVRRNSNYCTMYIDFWDLYRLQSYDYFKERCKITKEIMKILFDSNDVSSFKLKSYQTNTNEVIIKYLEHKYGDKVEIKRIEQYTCWQPLEKLYFINPYVLWKNIFNKKLYTTLFKEEKLSKITIEIKTPMIGK